MVRVVDKEMIYRGGVMNAKQRKVLFIMSALVILMFLFPPYVIRGGE